MLQLDWTNARLHLAAPFLCLLGALAHTAGGEQRFIEQPEDAVVAQGQVYMARCTVADKQGPVQWLRDGFGLGPPGTVFLGYPRYRVLENAARGEYHLMITDIKLEDDAVFECQVGATQHSPGLSSRRATITVQLPTDSVYIPGAPQVSVIAEEPHTLVCHALNGKPAPSITWSSSRPISDEENVTWVGRRQAGGGKREDAEGRLSFVPSRADEGREFNCGARNGAMIETRTASVTVHVLYKPEVTMTSSRSQPIKEGESLTITCSAVGNPDVTAWKWYEGGEERGGDMSHSFTLSSVGAALNGRAIECEARNSVGSTRAALTLNVQYGPRFTSEPDYPAASLGDAVVLTCAVDANPPPTLVWRRRGASRVLGSQSELRLGHVTDEHFSAVFVCTASAGQYDEIHRELRIVKIGPPRIQRGSAQTARWGEGGLVECVVEGVPRPSRISWVKHGVDITASRRYRVREENLPTGRRSVLEIQSVQDADFTLYNCSASSELGHDWAAIQLVKQEVVPLWYIVLGVVTGVLIIVAVIIGVVVYQRRQRRAAVSESSSSGSDDSVKKGGQPTLKIEFSSDSGDGWPPSEQGLLDPHYPPRGPGLEYDELHYPMTRDPTLPSYPAYTEDPYSAGGIYAPGSYKGRDPYERPPPPAARDNIYGTYPRGGGAGVGTRPVENPYGPRPNGVYGGSDVYGTYGRMPRYGGYQPPADFFPPPPPPFDPRLPPPPASPTDSRLSTNV